MPPTVLHSPSPGVPSIRYGIRILLRFYAHLPSFNLRTLHAHSPHEIPNIQYSFVAWPNHHPLLVRPPFLAGTIPSVSAVQILLTRLFRFSPHRWTNTHRLPHCFRRSPAIPLRSISPLAGQEWFALQVPEQSIAADRSRPPAKQLVVKTPERADVDATARLLASYRTLADLRSRKGSLLRMGSTWCAHQLRKSTKSTSRTKITSPIPKCLALPAPLLPSKYSRRESASNCK